MGAGVERTLRFWDVFCIAAGAMISSGLFVLPGLAFAQSGPAVILSYALAGVMVIPALLCQAELASAMPRAGGSYLHIERALGTLPGTFAGLAGWLAIALKSAFALIGMGAFAHLIAPQLAPIWIKIVAVISCGVFTGINCLTVKGVGRLQVAMVVVLLVVIGAFVILGGGSSAMRHERFASFLDDGPWAVLATSGLVFVSFGGLLGTANVAGEIRNPGRTLPLAMLSALIVVCLLYVAAVFVTVGVTPADQLSGNLTPLSLAAGQVAGRWGEIVLASAALLAYVTTANGGILEASRAPVAMSHDGLLPPAFGRTSRRNTPVVSVLATGAFMAAVIAGLSIENLVKVASTMLLVLYVLTCLSVIILRWSPIQNYRPVFRVPFSPWVPLAGMGLYALLIADMGLVPLVTTGLFAIGGVLWYLVYVGPTVRRESALVYLVKNAVSRDIYRSDLEDELKHIALERDEIQHDRFDALIQSCEILDIPDAISADELFRRSAETLADDVGLSVDELHQAFRQRETTSSTVLQPGLAIPHVIVPGQNVFDVLVIRCRGGVVFPGQDTPVWTAFVLVGSADRRNDHLRALMAIAHIVQEHDFQRRWMQAHGDEHLRDILLLSSRRRHD